MKLTWAALAMTLAVGAVVAATPKPPAAPAIEQPAPAASPVAAPVAVPAHQQLRHQGGWMVDRDGRVVILHGVNAVWKRAPYAPPDSVDGFTAADADWLAEHGFNAVRLGVLFAGVMPQRGVIDHDYLDRMDRVVKLLAARQIYVMIDFHQDLFGESYSGEGFPTWAQPARTDGLLRAGFPLGYVTPRVSRAFDGFWNDPQGLQAAYAQAWVAVAKRWRDADYLMGYDLINEPWGGSHWPVCARPGGCARFELDKLQPLYEQVLAGIRAVDPDNIVWLEPQVLFEFGADSHLGSRPIADAQLGLSWHNYCIAAPLVKATGAAESQTCSKLSRRVYRNADTVARRLGSASVLSEFGASDDAPDIARVAGRADEHRVGWMYWSYKDWGDPTTQGQGTGAQSMFQRDTDLASVKRAKLMALERPFPQAIAGVPLDYGFDAASRRFTLRYSTTLASGRKAPRDAVTLIHVPALHYPDGYTVQVQGGRVVSAANARQLRVIADEAATQVTIRVTERLDGHASF
ncbi:MAG: cellulase family glycosylhydrolase [Gammaproteobacteria bacterium]|nr:cellulase family glycosylhydrolase [Gammaproteobacteria bacterium]